VRRWVWANALSLVMFGLFAVFIFLQSIFGWRANNAELVEHAKPSQSYFSYLGSGHFIEATFENWESEFLQMGCYVLLTAFLIQRGSAESKSWPSTGARSAPAAERPSTLLGRFFRWVYENSLAIALFGMFGLSFLLHLLGGTAAYNEQQIQHGGSTVSVGEFFVNPEFWYQSMQNWQSEFLAVGALIVMSIFLRQKGSPQSKKVSDPDAKTGS
jgi:hypothetical protein